MADNSGGNGGLYFIVGGLVVVVAVVVLFITGNMPFMNSHRTVNVQIEAPKAPK
jgi:hypothetical protein